MKARYYTNTLIFYVQSNQFCQSGDSIGDGTGGSCIYALLDNNKNTDVDWCYKE